MKTLFDTSILVAALVENHSKHERALPWLSKAKVKEFEFVVSSHTLAELYAVLSSLPVKPRITPGVAWKLIHENVESVAKIVSLSSNEYNSLIKRASERGFTGGIIYEALIAEDKMHLANAVERNKRNRETFSIPSAQQRNMLQPGEYAQLIFEGDEFQEEDPQFTGERMWVKVLKREGKGDFGELANDSVFFPDLCFGKKIHFLPKHIIDIDFEEESPA